jgi:hypothetical protein
VIRELLKKLPEYLRLQWEQHMVQIRLNDVISKVKIGNEDRLTKWPTEVKNGERNKNYNSIEVSNNNKMFPICQFGDHKLMQCSATNPDRSLLKITGSVSAAYACWITARVIACQSSLVVLTVVLETITKCCTKMKDNQEVYTILISLRLRAFW